MNTLKLNRTITFDVEGTYHWVVEMKMLTVDERLQVNAAFSDEDPQVATRFLLQLLSDKLVSITSPDVRPEEGTNFLPDDRSERMEVIALDYPFGIDFINAATVGYMEALRNKVESQKKG
jgi:hypothetical protein